MVFLSLVYILRSTFRYVSELKLEIEDENEIDKISRLEMVYGSVLHLCTVQSPSVETVIVKINSVEVKFAEVRNEDCIAQVLLKIC